MQKQTIDDFILSQIAQMNPQFGDINLKKPISKYNGIIQALFKKIECRYGININDSDVIDIKNTTLEDLRHIIVNKIKENVSRQIDSKTIFENFVFSGRCKRLTSPYEINLDITFRCNYRCIFCYASSADSDEKQNEMNIDEIFDIIDEFKELNGAFILFGGGEPFIREDFLEIFRYTKSKGLWTYIITNGSLITEEVAYEYAKYVDPLFDKIQVSLDGSSAKIHDKQRGVKGAFEQTLCGIKNLVSTGKIRPIINTVVTQINYEDIQNILNLAIENNAMAFRCLKLHKLGRGNIRQLYNNLELSQKQYDDLYDFLTKQGDELLGVIGIASDNACVFPMSTKAIRDNIEKKLGCGPASYSCAAGTTKLAIAPDGGVVPCSYFYDFPEFYIGSLREKSLKDIWENEEGWEVFRKPLTPDGKCKKCDYLYTCKTGCRIMSYVASGSMGGPDIGCTYNPEDDI